jgi:hypothetical protein
MGKLIKVKSMARFSIIILITTQVILLSACQLSSLTSSFFKTPAGAVLYQDDFSDPSSGWENYYDGEIGTMDYFDGFYRIQVLGDHQMLSTGPGLNFDNTRLDADMIKVVGQSDDMFGVVCRAADPENYYFFVISSDGYYGIGKVIAGEQAMLDSPGLLPSEIISQGKTKNHLRADCIAEQLVLSVNGQELASVDDFDLTSGDVGILAATLMDTENVVLFDNFSVTNP